MIRIWAIGDLHLGFSTGKWMDRFGSHWIDHHVKVEASWRERVVPNDIVLLPGDFSWAMKPGDVARDFAWLAQLPGRKVLIKGNHDYWWPKTATRMQELLPPDTFAIKRKALVIDGIPFIGVRGGDFAPSGASAAVEAGAVEAGAGGPSTKNVSTKNSGAKDAAATDLGAELERERHEFTLSIEHLATLQGREHPPIALFHYPPFPMGASESFFTRMVEDAGARTCLFGHLHTQLDWERVFQGEFRGVTYRLVSCDFLDFKPLLIQEVG